MDSFSDMPGICYELPLSEAGQAALRSAELQCLCSLPFNPGDLISRSLWLIFIGPRGAWTRATLPIDDRLDMPDQESIGFFCNLIANSISPPLANSDEKAMIVLRRPDQAEISEADSHIFRLMRQATAGRKTMPWAFHVVGPGGISQVTEA
jgi:hypothetical protein